MIFFCSNDRVNLRLDILPPKYYIRVKDIVVNTFGSIMFIIRQYRKPIYTPKNARNNIYGLI